MSSRPARTLRSVVLPQPEGPSSTRNSPSSTWRSRFVEDGEGAVLLDDVAELDGRHPAYPLSAPAVMPWMKYFPSSEVDDQRRRGGEQRAGHDDVVEGAGGRRRIHVVEDDGHRLGVGAAEGHADEEIVPDGGDLQDQDDDQDIARHRQHDAEENPPEPARIDHRRRDQLRGNAAEIVGEDQGQDRHRQRRMDHGDAGGACRRCRRPAVILISGNMMIWKGTKAQMNMVKRSVFAQRTCQSAMA